MSEYEEDIQDEQLDQQFENDDDGYGKGKGPNKYKNSKKTPSDGQYEQSSNPKNQSNDSEQENSEADSDSDQNSHEASEQSEQIELTQEQKLEAQIVQIAINNEQSTPYQNELTMELLEKLKDFKYLARTKSGEDLITARIQELVINKLLVLTYSKSQIRLILSHYHLGQAYLANDCIEQSIEHISLALHKIEKQFEFISESRLLQTYMQNDLARALIQKQNFEDAIELLNESISEENRLKELRKNLSDEQNCEKNTKALVLLSQCYTKINDFQQAANVIDQVISIAKKKKMAKEEYAFALVQKAKILGLQKKFNDAINYQQEAIEILMEENYAKPEEVAELYTVLSSYHEQVDSIENCLTCIQKVKTLYQELYSAEDKRVIKARRKIATFLLKSQRFKEAVNELLEVVQLEQKVFGQNSLQTARTLKLLGAVYISMEVADARAYLKRAMNIFQSHGNKKLVQQIRDKLKMLYNGGEDPSKEAIHLAGSEHEI